MRCRRQIDAVVEAGEMPRKCRLVYPAPERFGVLRGVVRSLKVPLS